MKQFNKLFMLLLAVLLMGSMGLNAQTITVGTGTGSNGTTTASPINIWYKSLHYQTVYTAAEIIAAGGATGAVLQMGFDITGVPTQALPNYTIQMKHTTALDAAVYDGTGLMQVYNTASYVPVLGFDMFTLQVPFAWNGTDNLLIDICFDQVLNFAQTGTVNVFSATNGANYIRSDNVSQCGVPSNLSLSEKPVIQMVLGAPPVCSMTSLPAFSNVTPISADATWTPTGTPTSYIVEYGLQGFVPGTGTIATPTASTYAMTSLTPATDYMFRVQGVCGTAVGDTSFAAIGYFSTDCPATLVAPFTESFGGAGIPCLTASNGNLTSGGGWNNVGWIAAGSSNYSAPSGYDDNAFVYFETQGANPGDTDTLSFLSVDLMGLTSPFMDFYWFLDYQWASSGSFDVQIEDGTGNWVSKFTRSGSQNVFDWSYASIDLSSYSGTIGIRIVGEASAGWEGGAGIDRVRVKEAPVAACAIQGAPLLEGFESGGILNACWEQGDTTVDNLDWIVQTGATPSGATGPTAAADGSYYAFIESSSPVSPGDSAILMSPPINTDTLTVPAIYFNYHMFGNDYMRLRVEYEVFGSEVWNSVWEQVGQVQTTNADPFADGYIPLPLAIDQIIRVRFIAIAEANDGVSTGSGTAFASDIAIDAIRVAEVIANDVTITNVFTPTNGCGFGIEAVTIELTNRGFNDQTGVPVFLSVNGGAAVGATSGTILGNNGVGTVTVMVDMSTLGSYDMMAFTILGNDEFPSNDTMMVSTYSQPQITGASDEHFEMSDGYWYATGDWAHGMPSGAIISDAGAGANAFVTNLSGNYADANMNYLYSPCFDISAMTSPFMRFSINWDIENDWDGAWLEYSMNGGMSWDKLGANGLSGQNWYTDSITNNPYGWVWNGTGTEGSGGWIDAIIDLQPYGLTVGTNVAFRFVLAADAGTNNEGLGIDNFGIFDGCIPAVVNETLVNESVDGAADGAITLNPVAGFGSYTFAWSNGATTNGISGLAPGTYDVTVTDGLLGCTATESFTIISLCPISLGLSATIGDEIGDNEANGSVLVAASAGTAPYAYSWSNGTVQDNAFGLTAGTYTVVVTDATGCTDTIDAVVGTNYLIGTENIDGLTGLLLSPNPAKDYAQLDINFANPVDLTVTLVDVTGRVLETRHQGNTASEQMRFEVSNLAEGVYFLKITANGESATKRFVIVK
jgi:translation elongation factor EF-1beta